MMPSKSSRYGYLLVFLSAGTLLPSAGFSQEPTTVQTRVFNILYEVNEKALPLDIVEIWYTPDHGATWHQYGFDEDRQSPFTFSAPAEGSYGFFLRLINATGASSGPPSNGTQPHKVAFVDFTPPVVQLHAPRQTFLLGRRVIQIRWTAVDAHFTGRPIEIEYQQRSDSPWHRVAPDPMANTGRFDWRLPEGLAGRVALRLIATDMGNHRTQSEPQVIEIVKTSVPAARPVQTAPSTAWAALQPNILPVPDPTAAAQARARRVLQEATAHRARGEYRLAVARLREVLKLDPQMTEAFAQMGATLYHLGDYGKAANAYELALRQDPMLRSALKGAAMVYRQQHDYTTAAERLRTILRYNPNDAETWMNLGDIGIYQGDEVLARECYLRAVQLDSDESEVTTEAHKRLSLMAEVSRAYHPTKAKRP